MVRSLAVILIPILLIAWFFTRTNDAPPVRTVDWKPVVARARAEASFPIYAPPSLASGYRVNKASWVRKGQPDLTGTTVQADQWELGMLNPDDVYVEIDEQNRAVAGFVADNTRKGGSDGTSTINGASWQRLISPDERTRSVVLTAGTGTVTVIVHGDLDYGALDSFAQSLTTS